MLGGGGGPDSTGEYFGMKELSKALRSEVLGGLESERQNLINNALFDWKPVEFLQDRRNVTARRGFGDDAGNRTLNHFKFMDIFQVNQKEERNSNLDGM